MWEIQLKIIGLLKELKFPAKNAATRQPKKDDSYVKGLRVYRVL
jgi:hypothetical protein